MTRLAHPRPPARGIRRHRVPSLAIALTLTLVLSLPVPAASNPGLSPPLALAPEERVLTLVGTNDIHGGLEPTTRYQGRRLGGMAWIAGHVAAFRASHRRHYGDRGKVVLLDAGDAIQGSLLSNHSEGLAMVRAMNRTGYDAAIAGNHGFDFGPVGWQEDKVIPGITGPEPRGALERVVAEARFPFLGANVTERATGRNLAWLPPFHLVPLFDGRNLAVIGLENHLTPSTTLRENVADLVFGTGKDELATLVGKLHDEGRADVFVAVFHEGDSKSPVLRRFLEALPRRSDGAPLLDAVIAGHSHQKNEATAAGIPYVQSYALGAHLGLIRLVLARNSSNGRLVVQRHRTMVQAAIPVETFPRDLQGEPVRPEASILALVREARATVAPIADRPLGTAVAPFDRDTARLQDSPAGNLITDMMRRAARTEVALFNSGDLREGLPAGALRYQALFQALPKNGELVVVPEVPVADLMRNLARSASTCGRRGALQISGLRIELSRDCDCPEATSRGDDAEARIHRVETESGRVLYRWEGGQPVLDPEPVSLAANDFLYSGGAGYPGFSAIARLPERRALRDEVADQLAALGSYAPSDFALGRYRFTGADRCPAEGPSRDPR